MHLLLLYISVDEEEYEKTSNYGTGFNSLLMLVLIVVYVMVWTSIPEWNDLARLRHELRRINYIAIAMVVSYVAYAFIPFNALNFWVCYIQCNIVQCTCIDIECQCQCVCVRVRVRVRGVCVSVSVCVCARLAVLYCTKMAD